METKQEINNDLNAACQNIRTSNEQLVSVKILYLSNAIEILE